MYRFKKHRGLNRYYKNLAIENDFEKNNWLDFENPNDHWHLHFDYWGYGNNSFKRRKPHLDKLFRHFDILAKETKNLKIEFQLCVVLLDYHSGSDALFLSTPEPHNSQFTFKVSELSSTTTLTNKLLNDYIDNLQGYEKRYGQAGEAFCFIFKKNVGQPF